MASYFVAYTWVNGGESGVGCTGIDYSRPISNGADIVRLQDAIVETDPKLGSVIITNWQRFEEETNG